MTGNERVQKVNVCLWAFLLYLFRVVNTRPPLGCPCAFHLHPAAIIIGAHRLPSTSFSHHVYVSHVSHLPSHPAASVLPKRYPSTACRLRIHLFIGLPEWLL